MAATTSELSTRSVFADQKIAAAPNVANSTVSDYPSWARGAGLSSPLPEELDNYALEAALFRSLE